MNFEYALIKMLLNMLFLVYISYYVEIIFFRFEGEININCTDINSRWLKSLWKECVSFVDEV